MRTAIEQDALLKHLTDWRERAHGENPFFPCSWLIDDAGLELISKTHPSKLRSVQDLVGLLGETDDWAGEHGTKLFEVIAQFEESLKHQDTSSKSRTTNRQSTSSNPRPVKRAKGITFVSIQTPESFAAAM